LSDADGKRHARDLSDFDEAVVIADMPPNRPFQFSLISEGGARQCTWQLFSKPAPSAQLYSDAVIIDLRRPSWCIDPNCEFDLRSVERVALGSDWKNEEGDLVYSIRALSFRKRGPNAGPPGPRSTSIGGTQGPEGWCWRSVAYDPQWNVAPVELTAGTTVTFPTPIETPFASDYAPDRQLPEIAADLPSDTVSYRDLTDCYSVELNVDWDPASPATAYTGGKSEPQFALQDDRNHTAYFKLVEPQGPVSVRLEGATPGLWPPTSGLDDRSEFERIRSHVTRLSIRSDRALSVLGVRCCDAQASCRGL
jgi:hypothetical protein